MKSVIFEICVTLSFCHGTLTESQIKFEVVTFGKFPLMGFI